MRLGLLVLIPLAAIGCGAGERTTGGADEAALKQEIAAGDDSWQAIVDAAKAEGEVHVRSVFPESVEADLFRRFEEATGIRVNYSRKGGSAPTIQTYLTEAAAGAHLADVLQVESSIAASMPADERMAEFTVPNEKSYAARYRERTPEVHPTVALVVPIVYNRDLIAALDAGVICSVGSETICRIAMEYMAMGLPVVGTDTNVIPEVVRHGETGIVVPAGDADACAAAMKDFAGAPEKARQMGAFGRTILEREYSLPVFTETTIDAYRKLTYHG